MFVSIFVCFISGGACLNINKTNVVQGLSLENDNNI